MAPPKISVPIRDEKSLLFRIYSREDYRLLHEGALYSFRKGPDDAHFILAYPWNPIRDFVVGVARSQLAEADPSDDISISKGPLPDYLRLPGSQAEEDVVPILNQNSWEGLLVRVMNDSRYSRDDGGLPCVCVYVHSGDKKKGEKQVSAAS